MTYPIDPYAATYAPFVGYFNSPGAQGAQDTESVIDADDLYLSTEGPTIRHFKNTARTEFWDEVLYATRDVTLTDPNAPLGGTGNQYPGPN